MDTRRSKGFGEKGQVGDGTKSLQRFGSRLGFLSDGKTKARFCEARMQPSAMGSIEEIEKERSKIVKNINNNKGGRGSNSHYLRLTDVKTVRTYQHP